jgi:hypothetical protein
MANDENRGQHAWFPAEWLLQLRKERAVLAVAAAITTFMDRDGRAWPSRTAIAKRAGIDDPRAVTKAIARIKSLALIEVETRRGRSTVYSLPKPSVMITQGNDNPGLSRPSTLGSGDRGTLGNGYRVERYQERNQRTLARSRAQGAQKKGTAENVGVSKALLALVSQCGFNGDTASEAGYLVRQCNDGADGVRRATHWLALAIAAEEPKPIEYAIRQTLKGEHFADGDRSKADILIGEAKAAYAAACLDSTLREIPNGGVA